jgi:hypothetical protein
MTSKTQGWFLGWRFALGWSCMAFGCLDVSGFNSLSDFSVLARFALGGLDLSTIWSSARGGVFTSVSESDMVFFWVVRQLVRIVHLFGGLQFFNWEVV